MMVATKQDEATSLTHMTHDAFLYSYVQDGIHALDSEQLIFLLWRYFDSQLGFLIQ